MLPSRRDISWLNACIPCPECCFTHLQGRPQSAARLSLRLLHESAHGPLLSTVNPCAAGRWCGGLVAVKIVAHNCALSSLADVLRESALSTSITHPNVVRPLRLVI